MITNRPVVAEHILSRINTEYYRKKILELRTEIAKIRSGRAGRSDSDIKSKESSLGYYEKEKQKYDAFVSELRSTKSALLPISKEMTRHSMMYRLIKQALVSVPGLSPRYEKMIKRASSMEYNKISSKNFKAKKKVLKMSKKISDQMYVLDDGTNFKEKPIILSKMLSKYEMGSISGLLAEYEQLLRRRNEEYPANLGLDKKEIDQINTILKTDIANCSQFHSSAGACMGKYHTLLDLKRTININSVTRVILDELLELYEDILKRGRALRVLNLILKAFSKTEAKDMPLYKKLEQICSKMEEEIRKLVKKANEKYDKKQIAQLKGKYDALEKAYREYCAIKLQYSSGSISYQKYLEEVGRIRGSMLKILEEFPELNQPEYEIDIVNGSAKDKAKLLSPEEGQKKEPLFGTPEQTSFKFGLTPPSEEDELLSSPPIVIPERLAAYETNMYLKYSEYKKSSLGDPNITFLGFLKKEQQTNHAAIEREKITELIGILTQKEERIGTIYKSYLKYRANLKDKKNYLTFSSWTKTFFIVDRYDDEFILRKDDSEYGLGGR